MSAKTPRLSDKEWARLAYEANLPLTHAEREIKFDNTYKSQLDEEIRGAAQQVMAAQAKFLEDCLKAEISRGNLPEWVIEPERAEDAALVIQEKGYNWIMPDKILAVGEPIVVLFRQKERIVSRLEIKLVNGE